MVTMPRTTPLESTTGSAVRSYFRNLLSASCCESVTFKATKVFCIKSRTAEVGGFSRNSRIRMSSINLPRSSTT